MRLSIAQAGLLMEGNRIGFGIEEEEERSKSLKQSGDVIEINYLPLDQRL